MIAAHRTAWRAVMDDLRLATHCHSCGVAFPVCLLGYTGTHCSKMCWKMYEFEAGDDFACPFGGCTICDGGFVSLARSKRHRIYSAPEWPMLGPFVPCDNVCIRTRPPVYVAFGLEPAA